MSLVDNTALTAAFSTIRTQVRSLINSKVGTEVDRLTGDKLYPGYNTLEKIGAALTGMRSYWVFDSFEGSVSESSLTDEFPLSASYSVCLASVRIIITGKPVRVHAAVLKIESENTTQYALEWPSLNDGEIPASSSDILNSEKVLYFCEDSVFAYKGNRYVEILSLNEIKSMLNTINSTVFPLVLENEDIVNFAFNTTYPILDEELVKGGYVFRELPPDFDVPMSTIDPNKTEIFGWFDQIYWKGVDRPLYITGKDAGGRDMVFRYAKSSSDEMAVCLVLDDAEVRIKLWVKLNEETNKLEFRFYPEEADATSWFKFNCENPVYTGSDSDDSDDLSAFEVVPYAFGGHDMPLHVVEKFMTCDRIRLTGKAASIGRNSIILKSQQKLYGSINNGILQGAIWISEPFFHLGIGGVAYAWLDFTVNSNQRYNVALNYYDVGADSWVTSAAQMLAEDEEEEVEDSSET